MRDFTKVSTRIGRSQKFRSLKSDTDRLLYLLLLASPHINSVGCFTLPLDYATSDTAFTAEAYQRSLKELARVGLVEVDAGQEIIRVTNWFGAGNEPSNPKHAIGMLRELGKVKNAKLVAASLADLKSASLMIPFMQHESILNAMDRVSKGITTEIQMEMETERETISHGVEEPEVKAVEPKAEHPDFEAFWSAYPKRHGSADRKAAVKAFPLALARAGSLDTILWGVKRYHAELAAKGKIGTEYVKQARTWLNADGWSEYQSNPGEAAAPAVVQVAVIVDTPQWDAWARFKGKTSPRTTIRTENRLREGWYFPTEWPPGHDPSLLTPIGDSSKSSEPAIPPHKEHLP